MLPFEDELTTPGLYERIGMNSTGQSIIGSGLCYINGSFGKSSTFFHSKYNIV